MRRTVGPDSLSEEASDSRVQGTPAQLLQWSPLATVVIDAEGTIEEFNTAAERIFRHTRERAVGLKLAELLTPKDGGQQYREALVRLQANPGDSTLRREIRSKGLRQDGSTFPVELVIAALGTGPRRGYVGYLTDLTEREGATRILSIEREVVQNVSRAASPEDEFPAILKAVCAHAQFERGEWWERGEDGNLSLRAAWNSPDFEAEEFDEPAIGDVAPSAVGVLGEANERRGLVFAGDVGLVPEKLRSTQAVPPGVSVCVAMPLFAQDGSSIGSVRFLSSRPLRVGSQVKVEENASQLAGFLTLEFQNASRISRLSRGPLTGLATEAAFGLELDDHSGDELTGRRAVLLIGFLGFDRLRASLGQPAMEGALRVASMRVDEALPDGITAKLGGEVVATLLAGVDEASLEKAAKAVLEAVRRPIEVDGAEIRLRASAGACLGSATAAGRGLLDNAYAALSEAGTERPYSFRLYNVGIGEQVARRKVVASSLQGAMKRGELLLHYQPIVSLPTCKVTAFEALLRWNSQDLGPVAPGEFIPLAEQSGLIVPLGEWVLQEAVAQLARWNSRYPDRRVRLTVNVAALQLHDSDLPDGVARLLAEHDVDPSQLGLEITETTLLDYSEIPVSCLWALKKLGIRLLLDDFGTGYASLSYLQRFPINALKIDQSFTLQLGRKRQDMHIIMTIVSMAKALAVDVVAEGVETLDALAILTEMGCGSAQGYLFSKPLPVDEADAILADGRSLMPSSMI